MGLEDSAEGLTQHLALYEFRKLTAASIECVPYYRLTGRQCRSLGIGKPRDSWIVLMLPVLDVWLDLGVMTAFARYTHVKRLEALLARRPGTVVKSWNDCVRALLHRIAPKLLVNLTPRSVWNLLIDGVFKAFDHCDLIFREGDAPDGYYVCLHGSVAIHKLPARPGSDDAFEAYGERLVELKAGSSFGEVGFSAHAAGRAATVVALGEPELHRSESSKAYGRTICYVVSADTFRDVFGERTKQFDAKVDALKANALYHHWPMEDLYKLAVRMQRKVFKPNQNITNPEHKKVVFIRKGVARVYRRVASKDTVSSRQVALLASDDIFGVCEMVSSSEDERWLVAYTEVTAFVVSLAVAEELSHADAKTHALLAKHAEARAHWESVCLASKKPVSITFDMMKYSKYLVNPNVAASSSSTMRGQRRTTHTLGLNVVREQTTDLLDVATSLERDGRYVEAEDALSNCLSMCTDKLKMLRQLHKDGRHEQQHIRFAARDLRRRISTCEERSVKVARLRVKSETKRAPLKCRQDNVSIDEPANTVANQATSGARHEEEPEDGSPLSTWSASIADDGDMDLARSARHQPSLAERYEMNAPSVTDEMDAATRRRVRIEALDFALSFMTSDEESRIEAPPQRPRTTHRSEVASSATCKHARHIDFECSPPDERSRTVQAGKCTFLNHLEVTPLEEVSGGKKLQPKLGSALKKSRALHASASLLSLQQEQRLGQYGLPELSTSSSTSVLRAGRGKSLRSVGNHLLVHPRKSPQSRPTKDAPRIHAGNDEQSPHSSLPQLQPDRQPVKVQKVVNMHRAAAKRNVHPALIVK